MCKGCGVSPICNRNRAQADGGGIGRQRPRVVSNGTCECEAAVDAGGKASSGNYRAIIGNISEVDSKE